MATASTGPVERLTNRGAALAALGGKCVVTQLLQYFPRRSWKFVQLHHHVLKRFEEPIHVFFTGIQERK